MKTFLKFLLGTAMVVIGGFTAMVIGVLWLIKKSI